MALYTITMRCKNGTRRNKKTNVNPQNSLPQLKNSPMTLTTIRVNIKRLVGLLTISSFWNNALIGYIETGQY